MLGHLEVRGTDGAAVLLVFAPTRMQGRHASLLQPASCHGLLV
jgi:hypothetical protein